MDVSGKGGNQAPSWLFPGDELLWGWGWGPWKPVFTGLLVPVKPARSV